MVTVYDPIGGNPAVLSFLNKVICCDHFEYNTSINLIEAPSFCDAPAVQYVPGLTRGRATASGTFNTGTNGELPKLAAHGTLSLLLDQGFEAIASEAIVESVVVTDDADGKPYFSISWVFSTLEGVDDFSGSGFQDLDQFGNFS